MIRASSLVVAALLSLFVSACETIVERGVDTVDPVPGPRSYGYGNEPLPGADIASWVAAMESRDGSFWWDREGEDHPVFEGYLYWLGEWRAGGMSEPSATVSATASPEGVTELACNVANLESVGEVAEFFVACLTGAEIDGVAVEEAEAGIRAAVEEVWPHEQGITNRLVRLGPVDTVVTSPGRNDDGGAVLTLSITANGL